MPVYVFRTEREPRVIAFATDTGLARLPPTFGPWRQADGQSPEGIVGLPDFIRNAVAERGYVLLHIERDLSMPRWNRANDG